VDPGPERLGVTPTVEVGGFPAAVDLCVEAESLGYTDVWTAEVGAADAFSPLAAVAARTSKVRLGTALIPVYTRPPALAAMSAAGLQALSRGRFVLGVGASSPAIVGQWMGQDFIDPVTRVREYVEVLRDAMSGRKVSFSGETLRSEGFRLQVDPTAPVPVYVGALGPRMMRLAGAIGDGVLLFLFTPSGVRAAVDEARAGAADAGRDPDALDVFIRLPVVLDEPDDLVRFMARRMLTGYAIVPAYNASLARQGFAGEAAEIAAKWAAGDRDGATTAYTDEMLDRTFLSGDADTIRARIEEYREAGVRTPTLMPLSFAGTIEERAGKVAALVRALAPG
jgi:probable F420-dependent oxidoreductase